MVKASCIVGIAAEDHDPEEPQCRFCKTRDYMVVSQAAQATRGKLHMSPFQLYQHAFPICLLQCWLYSPTGGRPPHSKLYFTSCALSPTKRVLELFLNLSKLFLKLKLCSSSRQEKCRIENLIKEREIARDEKNWQRADEIRAQLSDMKVVVEDGASGSKWRIDR